MGRRLPSSILTIFLAFATFAGAPAAADMADRQGTVDKSLKQFELMLDDPTKKWFREHIDDAHGIMILPNVVKAGFIFGGSGGNGVLLRRDPATGTWSYPAFYTIGAVTFGLQIGAEVAQIAMLVMTEAGMDALLSTDVKLGADASIAVGPVGTGVAAQTADILLFSREKGLFGGLTIEGSVLSPRDSWNAEYYGQPASARQVLMDGTVSNPAADPLRAAIAAAE